MPTRLKVVSAALVLVTSAIGGWLWSNSNNSVDARLTQPGVVAYPSIKTNKDLVGRKLPDVPMKSLAGSDVSTGELLGTPLVINFWYSTCEPCRREMPVLAASFLKNKETVRFIGVNMNDSPEIALKFARSYGVEYELFVDPSGSLISDLGIATAPFTLFVGSDGVIVAQVAGELTTQSLQARIDEIATK